MRNSGILMHITSLPGPYGIGTMGKCAYEFIDFLEKAGQSVWQILPIHPTGYGDSPYQALSTFAGNPYLIDLDMLVRDGLLQQEEPASIFWGDDPSRVDFGIMYRQRSALLKKAYDRFQPDAEYENFVKENAHWLPDYGMFMALKEYFGGQEWTSWPEGLKFHCQDALEQIYPQLEQSVQLQYFLQYQFYRQWRALRRYANEKGIRIIGDVPIYVPLDSADVWASPELFWLDDDRRPVKIAGCPPDAFSADGQRWGNPLYRWQKMKETDYAWWSRRLGAAQKLYDTVRIDHFRGFESYWAIPAEEETAKNGCWMPGPGMDFMRAMQKALPGLSCIAEDLGFVTPEVRQLQLDSGYPGMKVIEFAFDSREDGNYLPHLYPENSVCYSGTHDNMPLAQWFLDASQTDIAHAKAYLGLHEEEGYVRGMIRGAMSSVSSLCVVQMQDYLELDGAARMNTPGLLSGANWTWRVLPGVITETLALEIRQISQLYGRAK